jgi:hypothetical protein
MNLTEEKEAERVQGMDESQEKKKVEENDAYLSCNRYLPGTMV